MCTMNTCQTPCLQASLPLAHLGLARLRHVLVCVCVSQGLFWTFLLTVMIKLYVHYVGSRISF